MNVTKYQSGRINQKTGTDSGVVFFPHTTIEEVFTDKSESTSLKATLESMDSKLDKIEKMLQDTPIADDNYEEISNYITTHKSEYEALYALTTNKVDKVEGKGLSTNDYTTAEKSKVSGIATGATKNTFSSVSATLTTSGWNTTTKTQSIRINGMTATANGVIGLAASITDAQYIAACEAQLRLSAQASNTITVKCLKIPTVNIPIEVTITE